MQEIDQAISAYEHSKELFPDILDARGNLGVCFMSQKKYEDAIRLFQQELNLHTQLSYTKLSSLHYNLGRSLYMIGNDLEALFEFQKGMTIGPDFEDIHTIIGGIYLSRYYWNLAQAEFEKAIDLEPGNDHARAIQKLIQTVEYEIPWLNQKDNSWSQYSLNWRIDNIKNRYPIISQQIEIVDHGNGKYEKRKIPLER